MYHRFKIIFKHLSFHKIRNPRNDKMSPVIEMVGICKCIYPVLCFSLDNCRIVEGIHDPSYPKKSKTSDVIEMEGVPI